MPVKLSRLSIRPLNQWSPNRVSLEVIIQLLEKTFDANIINFVLISKSSFVYSTFSRMCQIITKVRKNL